MSKHQKKKKKIEQMNGGDMYDFAEPPAFPNGGIYDLKLKVGETIMYDLIIVGEPTPEASWTVNDKAIKHGGRYKVITERGKHLLKVSSNTVSTHLIIRNHVNLASKISILIIGQYRRNGEAQ